MRKLFVLLLVLMLLPLSACGESPTESTQPQETPAVTADLSELETQADRLETLVLFKDIHFYEQKEGDTLLCRVEYPVLLADAIQAKRNSCILSAVDALNAKLATQAGECYQRLLNSVQSDQELNVDYNGAYRSNTDAYVLRADSRALSVLLRTESFRGDGTESLSFSSVCFDMSTGRELTLQNVAAEAEVLTEAVKTALLEKYPDVEFYDLDTTMEQYVQEPERYCWTLDYQGVSFYFAPYELAPAEEGVLSVGLRFDDHSKLFGLIYDRQPYAYVIPLVEGQCLNYDADLDGRSDRITLTEKEEDGRIRQLNIAVNSRTMDVKTDLTALDAYLVYAGPGRNYLFLNAHTDPGYGYVSVYRLERGGIELAGMLYDTSLHAAAMTGECAGIPLLTSPDYLVLGTQIDLLGTLTGVKDYYIGSTGVPESNDEFYRVYAETVLTVKTGFSTAAIDPQTGRGLNGAARIEPGTQMFFLRSDGRSFVDMMSEEGICCRMYVSGKGGMQTVNGLTVAQCFDGIVYK